MAFWSKGNKKEKNEKSISKSLVISKSDGDIVHTSTVTSFVRQESSISQTTETRTVKLRTYSGSSPFNSQTSLNSLTERVSNATGNNTGLQRYGKDPAFKFNSVLKPLPKLTTNTDAIPFSSSNSFKASPPRSAFSSTPLTKASKPAINLNYKSPYPTDTRRGSGGALSLTGNNARPSLPIIPQREVPRSFNTPQPMANYQENNEMRGKLTVKVVRSKQFYDDQTLSKVPVYPTRSKHRGKLLIINNTKFVKGNTERKGAEFDEENAVQLFKQLRFEIVRGKNLSKKEMEKKIISFRGDTSLKKYDIATVIIMSHGTGKERNDSTEVACTDGELLQTTWITNQFDSTLCPHLSGKPKIFIFQCCRGNGRDVEHDAAVIGNNQPRKLSDMLIAYSTVPGFVSHRDPETGSWYIQAICKVFMEHAHDTDVENLLKIVDNMLAQVISNGSKQTSSFENRGFKTCFLHPQLYE